MLSLAFAFMMGPDASSPRPMDFRLVVMVNPPLSLCRIGLSIAGMCGHPCAPTSGYNGLAGMIRQECTHLSNKETGSSMSKPYPLLFRPAFKSRIWGGSRLSGWFSGVPQSEKIGEAWVLSDHKEGESPIANGPYQGEVLHEVMQKEPAWFVSAKEHAMPDGRFPLLIKVIDAADDLSVQVHPDDAYGYKHAGEQGKTECWWVLAADEDSQIVYGHNAKDASDFRRHVEDERWEDLLKRVGVNVGDFYFVPSGKLHALGKGIMVMEIQQSSDTTYRVYDYNRTDKDGNHRQLHLEDAIAVTQYPDSPVPVDRQTIPMHGVKAQRMVSCPYFTVDHWSVNATVNLTDTTLKILSVLHGSAKVATVDGTSSASVSRGEQVLLPDGLEASLSGDFDCLVTSLPSRR